MQLGMIGLGRMGANIVRRLQKAGHQGVVWDRDPKPGEALAKEGALAASSLEDLVAKLTAPRAIWTSSSMAEIRFGKTISGAVGLWPSRAFTSSTSAPAAASGGWSAAIA
jgi:6-phosphogluconate dehydrogenase